MSKKSEFTFVAFSSSHSLLCFTDDLVEKYEYCKDRLNNDGSDYDNGDSDFGIDNDEDNLFDNDIYGCEILFKKLNFATVNIIVEQIVLVVVNSKFRITIVIVRTIIVQVVFAVLIFFCF